MILAGGGVHIAGACDELRRFAETMHIPVVTTIMGKGAMPEDHPLYIGNSGMHGRYAANTAVNECDVLFSIGTRFSDRITGDLNEFAPNAKIIHVDIDTSSISRNVVVDVPVVSDAKLALEKLLEWATPKKTKAWRTQIGAWQQEHPLGMRRDKGLSPQMIMEGINEIFPTGLVFTDVGQHQMWATQYITLNNNRRLFTSGGLGTMGFGFPAAIGGKIGAPDKDVVCITGDGGFQMNMQELATAIYEKADITVCILNNRYLGMVRQFQQVFYGKRYVGTCLYMPGGSPQTTDEKPVYLPDFVKWAESYGALGLRVETEEDVLPALRAAKDHKGTTIIEFIIATEEIVLPMVKGGAPMSDMIL